MKIRSILAASAVIVATGFGGVAIAQDLPFPVQARQGQMKMMGLNLGVLVGMARGEAEYDAEPRRPRQTTSWPSPPSTRAFTGPRAPTT
jgi:cytochrome c556